jgi:hypothetical protein
MQGCAHGESAWARITRVHTHAAYLYFFLAKCEQNRLDNALTRDTRALPRQQNIT